VIRRSILEWESIPYGDGPDAIPQSAADRIAAVAAASPLARRGAGGILEHGRKGLRARGVVGVIATEGVVLEILPKIDVVAPDERTRTSVIRRRLIHMLAVALDIRIEAGEISDHDFQNETLLEILIRLFSVKLVDAVRQGMPRRYVAHVDDLPSHRGRLDVTRQFTTLAASPQKLACRFDALSEDIALNRIMKAGVIKLARIARSSDNVRRLRELAFTYADVKDISISALRWDDVVIDRTNNKWRQLLGLIKLLLGNRFQTTSDGPSSGFSLLFEMSTLFEEYVARMLRRAVTGTGLQIVTQGGRLYCLETGDRRGLFQTKPDILVKRDGRVEQVIDTKWKRIAARVEDPKHGVAQSDLYQMMAYASLYQCPRLTLLYPHYHGLGEGTILTSHRILAPGREDHLEVATIDISSCGGVLRTLRTLCAVDTMEVVRDAPVGMRAYK
jgi:5-methylcytosine-specific restriction enzyme subunit McrC